MGNHKLKLSHMIPNAWFYRLQDMNTKPLPSTYSSSTSKQQNHSRNSIYYTPTLHPLYTTNTNHNPPSPNHPLYTQPEPTEPTDHTHQDFFLSPTSSCYKHPFSEPTRSLDTPPSTSCSSRLITASTTDLDQKLPPIRTKLPTKSNVDRSTMVENQETSCQSSVSIKIMKEDISKKETLGRKPFSRIKIRSNSSKATTVCKKMADANDDHKREKKLSSNCCIVKSSFDPHKDLKESMVEMIMENNIRESKDLEKLLACYLSLNSNEYHDMIVKVFEQVWLSFNFSVQEI